MLIPNEIKFSISHSKPLLTEVVLKKYFVETQDQNYCLWLILINK